MPSWATNVAGVTDVVMDEAVVPLPLSLESEPHAETRGIRKSVRIHGAQYRIFDLPKGASV